MINAARKGRVPLFTSLPGSTERGALFDFGANYYEVGKRVGRLAAEVLAGRDPATVPIENYLPERILLNRAALSGLKDPWQFPADIVARAEMVGEGTPAAEKR